MFGLFDFNHDGNVSAGEFAMGMSIMNDMDQDQGYDMEDMISDAGLHLSDLEMMDEDISGEHDGILI